MLEKSEVTRCEICELWEKYSEVMANYLLFIDSLNTVYSNVHKDTCSEIISEFGEFVRLTDYLRERFIFDFKNIGAW